MNGDKVLVPGCGDGRDSRYLSSKSLDVTSFDISKGMLKISREKDPEGKYLLLDIRRVNVINDCFDGIWASGCLYHLKKEEFRKFIDNCKEILTTSGILYLNMKEGEGEKYLEKPSSSKYPGGNSAKELLAGKRFYSYYVRDELIHYLKGFSIIKEQRLKYAEDGFEFWLQRID